MAADELNKALSEQDLLSRIDLMLARIDRVNALYVDKVARQIKRIGELSQSSINRMLIMADMSADISDINTMLRLATGLNTRDLFTVYQQALRDTYTDPRFAVFLQDKPLPAPGKQRLDKFVQLVSVQTAQRMVNLSNTTVVSTDYRNAIDTAITAVATGVDDYKAATREVVQQLGYNGLQVQYPSGYHRRLDTAVRQNIIDGTNQIAQHASLMMGEELGMDAVELSAHARSAPDHEPVQGRVFLKAEFDKMQSGLPFKDVDGHTYDGFRRPIGEWNCMHIAMGFSTQHSVRRYTDEQLAAWAADNAKGCEIGGRHYSTYQAVQLMRRIETESRRQKDVAVAASKVGDMELRRKCQLKIDALAGRYTVVARASGITPRRDRMSVEGFRAIKVR